MSSTAAADDSISPSVDPSACGWRTWTPREPLSPRFRVDPEGGRSGGRALMIDSSGNPAAYGEWRRRVDAIVAGRTYRFAAHYRAEAVEHPRQQVTARVEWLTAHKRDEDMPVYVLPDAGAADRAGGWIRCEHVLVAPPDAYAALIRLGLRGSRDGTVWWDGAELEAVASPPRRLVKVATVFHRPRETASAAASVAEFVERIARDAPDDLDLVCLPEGITVIGTGKGYDEVAEPLPGPTTAALGRLSARLGCYVVAGLYERAGEMIYNTAVLVDRRGELVGKYRKTHLPQAEADAGLTPGDTLPVFDLDFGRLGIMICWDVRFPEAARALAAGGAELIALPIWGGSALLTRARAVENHAFVVASSYDMRSFIVDPTGQVLAEATGDEPLAAATIDLARPIIQPWIADMKTGAWTERRSELG